MVFSRIVARDEDSSVGHPAATATATAAASTPVLPSRASEYALQALHHALRQELLPTDAEAVTDISHMNGEGALCVGDREQGGGGGEVGTANAMADRTQHQYHRRRSRVGEEHKPRDYDDQHFSGLADNRDDYLCRRNSRGSHETALFYPSPLVLDGGAVIYVPVSVAATSGVSAGGGIAGRGGTRYSSNRSGVSGARGGAVAVWNYVVSFAATGTIPGFPSVRKEASSVERGSRGRDGFMSGDDSGVLGSGVGSGPEVGVVPYAMITCEEDLKTLMDEAVIGADVLVKPRGVGELEERNSGEACRAVGCGDGYGLGGVDKQVDTCN